MQIIFESNSFSISSSLSKKNTPHIDGVFFNTIKNYALGKHFELSIVFIGKDKMRTLNNHYRNKNYATDILTFTLNPDTKNGSGEIFIYPTKAYLKAKSFDRTKKNYLQYLFVHGISHILGFDHETESDTKLMQIFEKKICKKFNV